MDEAAETQETNMAQARKTTAKIQSELPAGIAGGLGAGPNQGTTAPPVLMVSELRQIGEALFGSVWQSALASALAYDKSTITHVINGHRRMPPELPQRLREVVKRRMLETAQALNTPGLPKAFSDDSELAVELVKQAVACAGEIVAEPVIAAAA